MPRVCPECGRKFDNDVARCPDDETPTFLVNQDEEMIGRDIDGRYRVTALLGVGGMGAVYRARQHSMDRDVALKLLRRDLAGDEEAVKRFFREARAASKLTNPHTITVFDFGQTPDGQLYIAMELLNGQSLARLLQEEPGPMDPGRAVYVVDQVLDSLEEAHSVGVLHRDLKPDNIFVLAGAGARDFVKVLDFGIAKIQGERGTELTGAGRNLGTPAYMSPEQAQAMEIDSRSDLYAVGVVLFELLAGRPPFEGTTPLSIMLQKVQETPPRLLEAMPDLPIPGALDSAVAYLLARDPVDRPASATIAKAMLEDAILNPGAAQSGATGAGVASATPARSGAVRALSPTPQPATSLQIRRKTGGRPRTGQATPLSGQAPADVRKRGGPLVWILAAAVGIALGLAAVLLMSRPPETGEVEPAPAAVLTGGAVPGATLASEPDSGARPTEVGVTAAVDAATAVAVDIPATPPPPEKVSAPRHGKVAGDDDIMKRLKDAGAEKRDDGRKPKGADDLVLKRPGSK